MWAHLELVLFVLGALVERPVVAEPPDVINFVEAFNVVGHAVPLQDVLVVRDRTDRIDLEV